MYCAKGCWVAFGFVTIVLNLKCLHAFQLCQTLRVYEHHVLIYLVDCWVLLDNGRRSSSDTRSSKTILVQCTNIILGRVFCYYGEYKYAYLIMFCRLSAVFLAFDVLFVVFSVALTYAIGLAVCCCLPCIIAILYAVADQVCCLVDCQPLFLFVSIRE